MNRKKKKKEKDEEDVRKLSASDVLPEANSHVFFNIKSRIQIEINVKKKVIISCFD